MGLRFYRRIQIFPGIWLNLSKEGMSLSFGTTGCKTTLGKRGTRTSFGLPGTGIRWETQWNGTEKRKKGKGGAHEDE